MEKNKSYYTCFFINVFQEKASMNINVVVLKTVHRLVLVQIYYARYGRMSLNSENAVF